MIRQKLFMAGLRCRLTSLLITYIHITRNSDNKDDNNNTSNNYNNNTRNMFIVLTSMAKTSREVTGVTWMNVGRHHVAAIS